MLVTVCAFLQLPFMKNTKDLSPVEAAHELNTGVFGQFVTMFDFFRFFRYWFLTKYCLTCQ